MVTIPDITQELCGASAAIETSSYRLEVRSDPPRAVLADPAGRIWSGLSLFAAVDRVDAADETYGPAQIETSRDEQGDLVVTVESASTAWERKVVRLRCRQDSLELSVTVWGSGLLADVTLLGGRAVLADSVAGRFRSGIEFASVFVPTPTEPVQVVRSAHTAAVLGVLGDARPGRLHAVFSPPPLCLVFGRRPPDGPTAVPAGDWLSLSVQAPPAAPAFTELSYEPLDGGFAIRLDYDGHTAVRHSFTAPTVILRPGPDPYAGLARYRQDLLQRGWAPPARRRRRRRGGDSRSSAVGGRSARGPRRRSGGPAIRATSPTSRPPRRRARPGPPIWPGRRSTTRCSRGWPGTASTRARS